MARKPTSKSDTVVLPKSLVVGVQTGTPATGKGEGSNLTNPNISYFNKGIADLRKETDIFKAVRILSRVSGDVATAVATTIRLANTPINFKVFDSNHQISDQGTLLMKSLVSRFNTVNDYSQGYDDRMALPQIIESLLSEVIHTGACAAELILDQQRLPYRINPVSPRSLKWKISKTKIGKTTNKIIPWQQVQGSTVELDVPTFFYAAMDQDVTIAQSSSSLEAALNTSIAHSELLEDIRRVVRRSGHSRLTMTLVMEQLLKAAPLDIKADPAKLTAWLDTVRSDLQSDLEELNPESALVFFDTVKAEYLNSTIGASSDYTSLLESSEGTQATSLRTPPSVLGKRMGGSQNTSSTESLLFIKTAGGIQPAVQTVLSKAMTLAIRLMGFEGYVIAEFDAIDLRPGHELEAFKQMKQSRVLELLNWGFITDQEAAEMLGTGMMAPGAPPLSGTNFMAAKPTIDTTPSPNGDPARRALTGNAPTKAGGKSQ